MNRAERVLVIDDDPGLRRLLAHVLSRSGYAAHGAASGAEGLRCMRSDPPDVVVCDIQMPGMDGYSVLRETRADAALATLPFLLLTAFSGHDALRRGMHLGADDFLAKPVRAAALLDAVGVALDKRRNPRGRPTDREATRRRAASNRAPLAQRVNGYRLIRKIGGSRTTDVFLAVDQRNGREAVLEIARSSPHVAGHAFTA